jgi:hypothetical protein
MTTLAWPEVNARRLTVHGLASPFAAGTDPADVARATAGVHAQILSAAETSAAMRIEDATRADVRRALWQDRTLVKTFGPRGTVHLLPAADLGSWMAALGAIPWRSPFPEGVRMTNDQTATVIAAIDSALRDAELTVDELTEAVGDLAGAWASEPVMPAFQTLWPRWRQVTDRAAYAGVLCYGLDRARKVTYTHPGLWTGHPASSSPVDPDEAVAWVVEAYVRSYGPATASSFATWIGAPPTWAAERMAAHGRLVRVELDGDPAYDLRDAAYEAGPVEGVRLLPYFDAFVVGSRPRHLLFPGRAAERALAPSGQAGNYPVLLVDGEVAGVWHQKRSGSRVAVTVEPLRKLSKARLTALEGQVARLGEIVEGLATLTIGEVSVGPHA